jgi:hypothetical protein
LVGILK